VGSGEKGDDMVRKYHNIERKKGKDVLLPMYLKKEKYMFYTYIYASDYEFISLIVLNK